MAAKTKPVKLDVDAHAHLPELQKGLRKASLPKDVEIQDILSALVLYTPVPQLAGMLAEYWRYTEQRDSAAEAGK
ncbi:MAG: hypothetical protein E6G51_03970 [Actinobacteria bacterium]|nr:MAG: hypothetical protein E6G51_03970 [Actinomycetota bacterium]